jgi:hypothetical protein
MQDTTNNTRLGYILHGAMSAKQFGELPEGLKEIIENSGDVCLLMRYNKVSLEQVVSLLAASTSPEASTDSAGHDGQGAYSAAEAALNQVAVEEEVQQHKEAQVRNR